MYIWRFGGLVVSRVAEPKPHLYGHLWAEEIATALAPTKALKNR